MKKFIQVIVTFLLIISINSCWSEFKFEHKTPKHYKEVIDTFINRGGCVIKVLKNDTNIINTYTLDTVNLTDTFNIVNNTIDTQIIKKDRIIWRDSIKTIQVKTTIEDSSRIVMLSDELKSKDSSINTLKTQNLYMKIGIGIFIILLGLIVILKIIK